MEGVTYSDSLTIPDIITYENLEGLWESLKYLIQSWARRYMRKCLGRQGSRLFDFDDLMQSGFLALCDLAQRWPCQNNKDFRWHLWYACWHRFRECTGLGGGGKKRLLEAYSTTSLDEQVYGDSEVTRVELLADDKARFEDELIERISVMQDYEAMMSEIDSLPEDMRNALLLTARDGLSGQEAAERIGKTPKKVAQLRHDAVNKVKYSKTGRVIGKNYWTQHVGIKEFRRTHISEVEKAVLQMEEIDYGERADDN